MKDATGVADVLVEKRVVLKKKKIDEWVQLWDLLKGCPKENSPTVFLLVQVKLFTNMKCSLQKFCIILHRSFGNSK